MNKTNTQIIVRIVRKNRSLNRCRWLNIKLFFQILFVNGPEQGCGGNINVTRERQFQTQSTEYYDPLQDCHWLINSPPGTNIEFTINEIDIKNSTFNDTLINKRMSCNSDYLEVC